MFSSPVPGRDSHLSFPIISSGFGGRQAEAEGTQLPPAVPGSRYPGKPGAAVFAPTLAASMPQPSSSGMAVHRRHTAATGKAMGAGMVEGKGMQLTAWAKPEQNDTGGKKAAFIQDAKLQLARKIPPSCFKTHASPGEGMAVEAGGCSQQLRPGIATTSFPFQHTAPIGANSVKTQHAPQGWGFLLELMSLSSRLSPLSVANWTEIRKCWHQTPLPPWSAAPCQAPRPGHDGLQGSPRS